MSETQERIWGGKIYLKKQWVIISQMWWKSLTYISKKKFLKQDNKENTLKHQRQIP